MDEKQDIKLVKCTGKGSIIQFNFKHDGEEKRRIVDRRKSLKGDLSKSPDSAERRKGACRLEDVIISLEIRDDKNVYVNETVLHKIVKRLLEKHSHMFTEDFNLSNLEFGDSVVYIETKMKFRNKIKQLVEQKGLSCEMTDSGVYLGASISGDKEAGITIASDKKSAKADKTAAATAILGFSPDDIKKEIQSIIFKVFAKCLNEVHPISGNYQRDALKQDVSLEQRIIFLSEKHYPKSEKYTYLTIISQVIDEIIKEYNKLIQLEAEKSHLEEKLRLTSDASIKDVIAKKGAIIQKIRDSSLEESIKTLYLYMNFFKDLLKVGQTKSKIKNVFKKVNDRQIEIIGLDEIQKIIEQILAIEKKLQRKKTEDTTQFQGYLNWLKNEINNEVYFIRFLWINNLKGKAYILKATENTFNAIGVKQEESV